MFTNLLSNTKKLRILLVLELLLIICLVAYLNFARVENSIDMFGFSFSDYPNTSDSLVSARGSWISDTKLATPLQAVEIHCWKDWGYCIESLAEVFEGKYLTVKSNLHTIIKWGEDEIVTKEETAGGCVEYQITFDRIHKKVTSLRTTQDNSGLCEAIQEEPIALYLGDGHIRLEKIRNQK